MTTSRCSQRPNQGHPYTYGMYCTLFLVVVVSYGVGSASSSSKTIQRFLHSVNFGEEFENDDSEREHEEEEEAEAFINVTVAVCIVLVLLALTLLFEHGKEHLEETCRHHHRHLEPILEKLFGEMTVLGFLSLASFIVTQTGFFRAISTALYGDTEELLELFELVHFSIFFVMIFFVIQVLVLVQGAIRTEREWIHMDRKARLRRRSSQTASNEEDDAYQRLFEALRHEFLLERDVEPDFQPAPESHRVPDDFSFGRYLSICLGNLLTHTVEVKSASWIFFAVTTIAYYLVCLSVEENEKVLVWTWVGMGWAVFLFNIVFERHLVQLRRAFAKPEPRGSQVDTESTELLSSLPAWCQVDLEGYLESRSWLKRWLISGHPNRQQTLFWMDQKGPTFYLIILQVNLIFTGLYTAIHMLEFLPLMTKEPWYILFIYLLLTVLPVLGIMLNKQQLVATLSQVCCMGVYRRPQVVTNVLREEKTAHVVRSFIILYKLRQAAEQSHNTTPSPRHHRSSRNFDELEISEICRTFDVYDHSGDGFITYDEFSKLMSSLGKSMDEESLRKIIETLDEDNSGCVSKAEFLAWYATNTLHEGDVSEHERATFLFSMFDENATGEITIGEFKKRLDSLHAGLTVDDVGAIVNELDADNSGSIGLEEFEILIEKYYPRELEEAE